MKSCKILSVAMVCALFSATSYAGGIVTSVGYQHLRDKFEKGGQDIGVGAAYLGIGYEFSRAGSPWSLTPELKYGWNINDDSIKVGDVTADIKLERYMSVGVRAQYNMKSGVYLYAYPTYAKAELEASVAGIEVDDYSYEFGGGAGIGMRLTKQFSTDISYEKFGGTHGIQLGIRYTFN